MEFSTWDIAIALMITVICVYIFLGTRSGESAVSSVHQSVTRHFKPGCFNEVSSEAMPRHTEHHHHHHNRLSGFSADDDGDFAPFRSRDF